MYDGTPPSEVLCYLASRAVLLSQSPLGRIIGMSHISVWCLLLKDELWEQVLIRTFSRMLLNSLAL